MSYRSAQVTIAKKWAPDASKGKTNWNLQDSAGVKYSTAPDLAALVQEGQMVLLDYEEKEFNGRPFKMTKHLTVTQGGTPMPAPTTVMSPERRLVGEMYQAAARPSNGPPSQDKHIFVTGTVGRAMGSGKFDPQDIRVLTEFACAAWDEFFRT